jgi:hypothetical protein
MDDRYLQPTPGTDARHRPDHGRRGPLPTRTADSAVGVEEQTRAGWVPDVMADSVVDEVLTGRSDRLSRRLVWVVLVVLFAGGWGQGLLTAVQFLAGHDPRDPHPSVSRVWNQGVEGFSQAALLVVAVVLAVRWAGVPLSSVGLRLPRTRGDWLDEVTGAGWWVLLTVVSFALVTTSYPSIPGQNAEILDALTGWLAGPTEEMVFIVAAVVLLRRAQYSWTLVVLVSAVARVAGLPQFVGIFGGSGGRFALSGA